VYGNMAHVFTLFKLVIAQVMFMCMYMSHTYKDEAKLTGKPALKCYLKVG